MLTSSTTRSGDSAAKRCTADGPSARLDHQVPCLGEGERDQLTQVRIIVGDQHLHAVVSAGSVSVKRVRAAAVRSKATRPP